MNCLFSTDGLLFHNLMTVAPVRGGHMSHEVTHYCALMQEVTGSMMMMLGRYRHTSSLSKYTVINYPIDSTVITQSIDNTPTTNILSCIHYITPSTLYVIFCCDVEVYYIPSCSNPLPFPLSPFPLSASLLPFPSTENPMVGISHPSGITPTTAITLDTTITKRDRESREADGGTTNGSDR